MVQVFRDVTLCFDICESKAEVLACKNGSGERQELGRGIIKKLRAL
jgi:hypothetical protein